MPTTASQNVLDRLGDLIRQHKERTGETVTNIAKRANVKRGLISQLMSGNYPSSPTLDVLHRICDALDAEVRVELRRKT